MKKLMIIATIFCIVACASKPKQVTEVTVVHDTIYFPVEDSALLKSFNKLTIDYDSIVNKHDSLMNSFDMLIAENDSIKNHYSAYDIKLKKANNKIDELSNKLLVDDMKLARIKEYNRIAAKGNNIKFLRGWINRVLSE